MKKKHLHFIGIKGVGMASLAIWAKEKGFYVTGSDVAEEFVTEEILRKFKIPIKIGFERKDLKSKPDLVIVTGAHGGKTNQEGVALATEGIEVITHGQAVGRFMEGKLGISVAGVGGKTTTSAMIATVLVKNRLDPSYLVGAGNILPLEQPGHAGRGEYFVVEADEYASCPHTDKTPRFLYQNPRISVVTNIEYDHPDLYKNLEETKAVFVEFMNKAEELVVLNIDNENNREVKKQLTKKVLTYGFSQEADYQIEKVHFRPGETSFSIKTKDINLGEFLLQVPGKYNAQNAVATIAVGLNLGLSVSSLQKGLAEFGGTKRRFELLANKNGVILYDDYAHHPTEIQKTLLAARDWYPKEKIICIFQPHTYSRTKALLFSFARCFGLADEVLILPIFPSAREKEDKTISSSILASEINKFHPKVLYIANKEKLLVYLQKGLEPNTIVFTMGAGDVYKLGKEIIDIIKS